MILYITGRQMGKSTEVLRWWLADPEKRVIYTADLTRANYLHDKLKKMVKGRPAFTPELLRRAIAYFPTQHPQVMRGDPREIAIDDVEDLLAKLFGKRPTFLTATGQVFGEKDSDG